MAENLVNEKFNRNTKKKKKEDTYNIFRLSKNI
jgi:hypothetical protein